MLLFTWLFFLGGQSLVVVHRSSVVVRQAQTAMHQDDLVRYEEGIRLFNTGAFWHAHEQWEDCWKHAAEPDATFFKGIIQAAAALVHWQRGNPRGVQRNWAKARPKLAGLAPHMNGIDLASLIAAMDQFVLHHADGLPAPLLHYQQAGADRSLS